MWTMLRTHLRNEASAQSSEALAIQLDRLRELKRVVPGWLRDKCRARCLIVIINLMGASTSKMRLRNCPTLSHLASDPIRAWCESSSLKWWKCLWRVEITMGTLINSKVSNPFKLPELRDELVGYKEVLVAVNLTHLGPEHKPLLILGASNQIL